MLAKFTGWGLLAIIRLLTGAQARWWGCPPKAEQRIYFANHQSHLDLVMIWAALPEELRAIALERELVVSDIGVYPYLNADQCEQIYNEIAVALLDFMFERPAAKDVLRGRTFVRTLH